MKLWMKSLLAMGVIGGTTGAAIGASYAFVKIDPSEQGYQYKSRFSKYTNIDKSNVTGLKARVVKHGGDFFDDKIAEIDLVKKQVEGKNIDDYFTEYASKHKGNSPDFVIHVGSMTFDNQYTTAIKPSEFIDFIKWFFKNVSWGPEISTLTSFSIIRGVEINGNTVTLGGHTSKRHETTNIKFYPDAFFGSLPMYTTITGPGSKPDSMLAKFGNASTLEDINRVVKNIAPLFDKAMKKNVQDNIGKKFGDITVNKEDVKNANYKFEKHLYPIGKFLVNGKHVEKYQTYTHINPELYSAIAKKYPYHLKETTGPVIERNSKGEYKIVTKKHKYMPISERIPMPEILSLNPKFKGIGSSWLHYVATHEYGHHQTLDAANDQSGKNVLLGAWQKINSPSFDGSAYNIKNVNLYLKARANGLQVRRVAASEAEKSKRDIKNYKEGIYAKFSTDNGKSFETNKQIFGTEKEDWIEINKEGGEDKEWLFKKYAKVLEFAQNYPPFAKQLQPSWRVFHPTKPSDWDKYPSLLDLISNSSNMPIILNNITLPPKTPSKKNIDTRALVTKKVLGKIYNGQPYKGYLLNAFDNNSGTLSEDIDAPAEVLSNGHYIKANDLPINPNWNKEELKIWNDMPLDYNLSGYNYINLDGKKTIDSAIAKQGRGKFTSDDIKSIFTDYTMTFPEVLTRDFVQITYLPSKEPLMPGFTKHKNSEENISESNTGFEYYIPKEFNSKWVRYRKLFYGDAIREFGEDEHSSRFWEQFKGKYAVNKLLAGNEIDSKTKESLKNMSFSITTPKYTDTHYLTPFSEFEKSSHTYIGQNLSMANGYFKDRFIRKSVKWSIYKDDGSQEPYVGDMTDLNGKKPTGIADAYWYYLLKSRGIGDRTITGIWRSQSRDAIYAYGYVPTSLSKKIKYLAMKNRTTGKVEYIQINTNQDNLHYYTNQANAKIKTLADEGYTSWTSNFFSSDSYSDAIAKPGEYTLYFTDSSKNKVDGLTLGSKPLITENGKLSSEAATKITESKNGLLFKVYSQFKK